MRPGKRTLDKLTANRAETAGYGPALDAAEAKKLRTEAADKARLLRLAQHQLEKAEKEKATLKLAATAAESRARAMHQAGHRTSSNSLSAMPPAAQPAQQGAPKRGPFKNSGPPLHDSTGGRAARVGAGADFLTSGKWHREGNAWFKAAEHPNNPQFQQAAAQQSSPPAWLR